jgi:hypothetical protein
MLLLLRSETSPALTLLLSHSSKHHVRLTQAVFCLAFLFVAPSAFPQSKHTPTIDDLLSLKYVSSPTTSGTNPFRLTAPSYPPANSRQPIGHRPLHITPDAESRQ